MFEGKIRYIFELLINQKQKIMKKLIVILLVFSFTYINAQSKITVEISELSPLTGELYVGLYNSESTYLKKEFKSKKIKVEKSKEIVVFDSIPNGTYAISTFHDANSNEKFDTYIFGIPKEGYSFSNNASVMFGPAKYVDASFEINGKDVVQRLHH